MTSFSSLLTNIRACTICDEHLPFGPRPILQIHPQAKSLIAGQAPEKKAHDSGVPFGDASGHRLREWLEVSRETFYNAKISHFCQWFCFPGTGISGDLPLQLGAAMPVQ